MEGRGEGRHVNEPQNQDDRGKEQDFSEFAGARVPPRETSTTAGRFLRGCGIALSIAFLVFAFVVGACFMAVG